MRAAFYECDITPPLGGFMPGNATKLLADDVLERLYAKALVVENNGEIAAIVVVDTVHLPVEMHEIVTKRVYEYTGIEPARVCIHSNHTHKGAPVIDRPEMNCFADASYRDVFFRLAADAIILAYKRLDEQEVSVKFGKIAVSGIAFNRDGILEDGTFVTHIRGRKNIKSTLGGTDPDLSVLSFEKDGKRIGAIINFACHQDCTEGIHGYTGDYSAVMAQILKEYYGNDFVSLFLLGACGDINHVNHDINVVFPEDGYRLIGNKLAEAARKVIETSKEADGGVGVIKETVQIKRRIADTEYQKKLFSNARSTFRLRNFLYYQFDNKEEYSELYIQAIKIGKVCIYALPGELFVQIGLDIKANSPFENSFVVENCHGGVCGYIPTKEGFAENSDLYEASLCYGSCLIPEACDILIKEALERGLRLKETEL